MKSFLEPLRKKISKDLLNDVEIIALPTANSVAASLDQQIADAYAALKKKTLTTSTHCL